MRQDGSGEKPDAGGAGSESATRVPRAGSLADRVDAALASKQTMVGGLGLPTAPREAAPAQAPATALMHAASPPATPSDDAPASEAPASANLAGRVIKGRYLIKRLLGQGGMGGVYEGEHLEIGRRVAIKLVSSVHARDPHIAARIKQEARSTGAIESEHIVQVFDAGEDDDLGLFLVMELLKGEDLSAKLAREKALAPVAAISLIAQAAQGLARAHAAHIVHRDLKPANIFLCTRDDGTSLVKLVDFGIAKLLRDASDKRGGGLTRMGMVIGTPQYMSPEQAQGLPSVDHRTDVYSLGAVLFEVLTGQSPFEEMPTYEQTILQIMMKTAPRLRSVVPDVLPSLDQLTAEMMAHDPSARPQEMSQVRDRLQRILAEMGAPASSATDMTPGVVPDAGRGWRGSISGADDPASIEAAAAASVPGTHSAVAVDPETAHREDTSSIAGLPRKRSGLVAAVGLFGLGAAIAGGVMLVRTPHPGPSTASTGSFGLVQGPASASPPVSAAATSASASPAAPAPSATASAPTAVVASAAPASLPTATGAVAVGAQQAKPASSTPTSHPAKAKPSKSAAHRVGATDIADDF